MKKFKSLAEVVDYIMDGEETAAYRWNNDGGDWDIKDIKVNVPMYDEQYSGYVVDIDTYDIYNKDGKEKLFVRIEDVDIYQVTDWYMSGENGNAIGTFDNIESARKCALEYISHIRKTKKESESSYIDICPLLDDGSLGDSIEVFHYDPVRD